MKASFTIKVDYNSAITDAESLATALDRLVETALSTPDILDDYGNPTIGVFLLEDAEPCVCEEPGAWCSGIPGILARVESGRVVPGTDVQRCDACCQYDSDLAARIKLVECGMMSKSYALELDGPLFRQQRLMLWQVRDAISRHGVMSLTTVHADLVEGLIGLTDAIADQAAERDGIDCLLDER